MLIFSIYFQRKTLCQKENAHVTQNWAILYARRRAKEVSLIRKTGNARNWEDEERKSQNANTAH